jgi:lipoate-protein ligase A
MAAIMSRSPTGDKTWLQVIDVGSASAVDTLAVAYGIASRLGPDGDPVLVLADPIEPFLCAGANEDIEQRIDLSFCRAEGIPVLRRRIGGRAIYIDRDQLIFHVIVPVSLAPRPTARIMPRLVTAMIETVRDFGLAARLRDPSDLLVGGRKIAGAAGAEIGDAVVVGGTFLFNFDSARMVCCLKAPSVAFRTRLRRLLDRRLTTFCEELGNPPPRRRVKTRLVGNFARCLDAEPHHAPVFCAYAPAIATAAAYLEKRTWHG